MHSSARCCQQHSAHGRLLDIMSGTTDPEPIELDASEASSAHAVPEARKRQGGPLEDQDVWQHFTKGDRNPTTKRYAVTCQHCQWNSQGGKVDTMRNHLGKCPKLPQQHKRARAAAANAAAAAAQPVQPLISRRQLQQQRQNQTSITDTYLTKAAMTDSAAKWDRKLLYWFADSGLAFAAVDSPWFLTFMNDVRPGYVPAGGLEQLQPAWMSCQHMWHTKLLSSSIAGSTKLRGLLDNEYKAVMVRQKEALDAAVGVTVIIDGWTNVAGKAVYAAIAATNHGQEHLLIVEDVSAEKHDAAWLSGE